MPAARLIRWPIWILALAINIGTSTAQANITLPATVEVDLVFPRNDTYTTDPLLPVVFAIQNPQAAVPLVFRLTWSIFAVGDTGHSLDSGSESLVWANYSASGNDPYFVVSYTNALNGTEGHFSILWELLASNCSELVDAFPRTNSPNTSLTTHRNDTLFTLQKGARQPSVFASPTSCPVDIATFNITHMLKIDSPSQYQRDTCAVLAELAPKASPCSVSIDDTLASSISASITASACATPHAALTSGCPPPQNTTNSAVRPDFGWMGWSEVVMGLTLGIVFRVLN